MAESREAVTTGLYIGPFAEQKVRAIGLEPPPMMWIFEWDILTGDSAVLDVISSVTGDRVDEAVAEGREAVATAERMRTLVAGTDPASNLSYLRINQGPGASTVSVAAVSNRTYTVQFTDNLNSGVWSRLADIVAAPINHVESFTDPGWTTNRFYRVRRLTP
jgi:hypothetical protein